MFKIRNQTNSAVSCTHCGDDCPDDHPIYDDKDFCCHGCEVVFKVLKDNGLDGFYAFDKYPGISQKSIISKKYDFLDEEEVVNKLLDFKEESICKLSFTLPQIHCASCVWLLENLGKLLPGILSSKVNFLSKLATISYDPRQVSLKKIVEQLNLIGYSPELNLQKLGESKNQNIDRSLYYKLGLAGFAFGNIMLLSFPEYLGFEKASVHFYLGYINILLALPIMLYSGFDYFRSAYWTIKLRQINIDIPIAIGMTTLFFRSVYEIVSQTGEGYLDSLAGFVFFLLIGKWFQHYTFYSISFDRNYKSYFPISALVKKGDQWKSQSLDTLNTGDIISVKNEEIIPGDSILLQGEANIDYSFVTGESDSIKKIAKEKLFAGGKNIGSNIEIQLLNRVDQSYLTKLWDEDAFSMDKDAKTQTLINKIGRYFTIVVLFIAFMTLAYWFFVDRNIAFNAFTAVLIVACPCALALAIPFSYGNILRLLGKQAFYLKNVQVIDRFQEVDEIIFDKTGTITDHKTMSITLEGKQITTHEKYLIKSAVFQSSHPISKSIFHFLEGEYSSEVSGFTEYVGKGIQAIINNVTIRVGSPEFIFGHKELDVFGVLVEINGKIVTTFKVDNSLRAGVEALVKTLSTDYKISILSGDNNREEERLLCFFPKNTTMIFNQSPLDKLNYVKSRQALGHKVVMIGDGLNDAGALKQSEVGIVISDDSNNFTPACDGILNAGHFDKLLNFLLFLKKSRWIIFGAFGLAFFYNTIGLFFAVRGELSPIIAAILMPLSSITVMIYGLVSSKLLFNKYQ